MPVKLTEEEATLRDSKFGIVRLEPYKGCEAHTLYLCPKCKKSFYTRPGRVWAGKVSQCNQCKLDSLRDSKLLTEEEATKKDKELGWQRLTPYVNSRTKAEYICKRCGSKFYTKPDSIWSGSTKSCGCIQLGQPSLKRKDRTGERYNSLTAIKFLRTEGGKTIWLWQCDCGRIKEIKSSSVVGGKAKTCGHCNDPVLNEVFGKLTVTKVEPRKIGGGCICECVCSCGGSWKGHGRILRVCNTQSCGCMLSRGNTTIGILLRGLGIQFETEKTFNGCLGDTGRKLRFDFYIPQNNLCIEYQGQQHYALSKNGYSDTPDRLVASIRRDQIKRDYCAANGITLYEIPYTYQKYLPAIIEDLVLRNHLWSFEYPEIKECAQSVVVK